MTSFLIFCTALHSTHGAVFAKCAFSKCRQKKKKKCMMSSIYCQYGDLQIPTQKLTLRHTTATNQGGWRLEPASSEASHLCCSYFLRAQLKIWGMLCTLCQMQICPQLASIFFWTGRRVHSLEWTQNGAIIKKKKKHAVSSSASDGNVLLMREVNEKWPDCFELTERPQ